MNTLQAGKLRFSIADDGRRIAWAAEGLPMRESESADFWRAYLDDGYRREMRVRSSLQPYGRVETLDKEHIIIHYDKLVGDDGREFDISLHVYMSVTVSTYAGIEAYAEIDSRDTARLNELQLPMADLDTACDTARERGAQFGHVHYAATKSGQLGMVKTLARTAAPFGVTVNAIAPGVILTELLQKTHGDAGVRALGEGIPLGLGTVEDVGAAAVYLASDEAHYVTGATIDINGGMYFR